MGIFKKKHNNIRFEEEGGRTPVRFSEKEKPNRLDKEEKKRRRKKIRRISVFVIIIGVLSALSYFGYKAWDSVQDIFANDGNILNLLSGESRTIKGEKEGRTNILLLGIGDEGHAGSTLSDSIILASIDYRSNHLAMFAIPRDLYVKIPGNGYSKINGAHAYGEKERPGSGPDVAKKVLEENFGVPIHYYARVDFSGLEKLVDALGGVNVDVENSFCDYNYPTERKGDTRKICFKEGIQTMNGVKGLQYSRSRHALGVEGSDFARSRRQQKLILAIKEKALSANTVFNPKRVLETLSVLGDHIKTDFKPEDFARLYELSKEIDQSNVISKSFDNSPEGMLVSSSSAGTGYILKPADGDFDEIKEAVKNIFSVVYLKEEAAQIHLENGGYNSYLFGKLSSSLKENGFNIVESDSTVQTSSTKTKIIDYSNGKKSETIRALEDKFNVEAVAGTKTEGDPDILIVVGRYYKG